VNNYPTFIFSPKVRMAKGRAIDTEQGNINDLKDLIEHRVFRSEMEEFGLYRYIDISGDTADNAKKRNGQQDGQADAINYARAILEYRNQPDVMLVKQIYAANGWKRSLQIGEEVADTIAAADPKTPKDVETVFLRCLLKLYPIPRSGIIFTLTADPSNKYFRRLLVNTAQTARKRP
jgi:hypothetical protein